MKMVGRTAASRRAKAYLIELCIPDVDITFDEDGEIEILDTTQTMCYPTVAYGPEDAIRNAAVFAGDRAQVLSIRRVCSAGLMRAMVQPQEEWFDLHRGELEELAEQAEHDE